MFGKTENTMKVAWVRILVPSIFYVTVHLRTHKSKLEKKWYMTGIFILRAH
jgi:hypothetical protein